jgi:UPF0716 family protein affecting phage T7 exclusion
MLYFLIYLFLEVFVSLSIASSIGVLLTFLEIIATALAGFIIIAKFGYSTQNVMMNLKNGKIDPEEFVANRLFSYVGAVLLVLPGFLTDIIGLLLQFEFTAMIFAKMFLKNSKNMRSGASTQNRGDDVIDVEVIEKKEDSKESKE